MVPNSIEREILIEAPVEVVWSVVTQPDHINEWFADASEVDLRAGGSGRLVWNGGRSGSRGEADIRVQAVEPPRLFSFRWVYPQGADPQEGNSALVEFTLIPEGGGATRLRVVESGFTALDWAEEKKAEYVTNHAEGWAGHLERLAGYAAEQVRAGVE